LTRAALRVFRSFGFAYAGIRYLVRTQPNVWVHLTVALLVLALAAVLGVRGVELAALVLAIGLVLAAEAANTSIEVVVDLVSPRYDPRAGLAKDLAAGAVLLATLAAIVVGLIVLLPRLAHLVGIGI
jgi:diacylglycerol kinase (ATP)